MENFFKGAINRHGSEDCQRLQKNNKIGIKKEEINPVNGKIV